MINEMEGPVILPFGVFLHLQTRSTMIAQQNATSSRARTWNGLKLSSGIGSCILNLLRCILHVAISPRPRFSKLLPTPEKPNMYLALIEPGSYLDFPNPVPFRGPEGVVERGVLNAEGRISGRGQSAVRPLAAADFNRIVDLGLDGDDTLLPRVGNFPFSSGLASSRRLLISNRTVIEGRC